MPHLEKNSIIPQGSLVGGGGAGVTIKTVASAAMDVGQRDNGCGGRHKVGV